MRSTLQLTSKGSGRCGPPGNRRLTARCRNRAVRRRRPSETRALPRLYSREYTTPEQHPLGPYTVTYRPLYVREVSVVFRDEFSVESEFQLNPAYPMQFGTLIPNIVFISNFKVIFKVESRIENFESPVFFYTDRPIQFPTVAFDS